MPKTRQAILGALFLRPDKAWYSSELARHLEIPVSSLQRELLDLTRADILKVQRQGRMAYYQANSESPLFPDLHGLFQKTTGAVQVLRDSLLSLQIKPDTAFIFGSMAQGTEQADSDIDLMVIGPGSPLEIINALQRPQAVLGREIQTVIVSTDEIVRKLTAGDHFFTRVMEKPKLFVIGNAHELVQLVGRP